MAAQLYGYYYLITICLLVLLISHSNCEQLHPPIFSNDLRLPKSLSFPSNFQYHGTTTLSFICSAGIIVAVDSRASIGNYVGSRTVKKIFPVTRRMIATMAGGAADCSFWIRKLACQVNFQQENDECEVSARSAAHMLSSMLREYKGSDLSVGTMIAGCDGNGDKSIYYVDNSGNCVNGDLFCVGSGANLAYSVMDSKNLKHSSLEEALEVAQSAIRLATHRDGFSGGYINIFLLNQTGCHHIRRIDSRSVII